MVHSYELKYYKSDLCNPCSCAALYKSFFLNPLNVIERIGIKTKARKSKEEIFIFHNQNNSWRIKMLREVESLTEFLYLINFQILSNT